MSRPADVPDVDPGQLELDDEILAAMVADAEASAAEFRRRSRILIDAADEGLVNYLTCPACRALVPIDGTAWPERCPRCGRCP